MLNCEMSIGGSPPTFTPTVTSRLSLQPYLPGLGYRHVLTWGKAEKKLSARLKIYISSSRIFRDQSKRHCQREYQLGEFPRQNASWSKTSAKIIIMAQFIPRQTFAIPNSIPKTYYLGHHAAGQAKIVKTLSNISMILECRDFRLPLSTHNPHLERALAGRERLVVYTKSDLGTDTPKAADSLRKLYGDRLVFWDKNKAATTKALLKRVKDVARSVDSLTGMRALIVGMPNVGKSTLLNALRRTGTPERTAKVAKTGDQAGVTRKVGTPVRILEKEENGGVGDGVYVLDTPGIFQPYVDDGETMIKIALVQGIKKGLIPDEILVDYLLYRINLLDPKIYSRYSEPTNDVNEFLTAAARKEGKLKAGGVPNWQDAAARILSQWRSGKLGKFVMDDLSDEAINAYQSRITDPALSLNQAKKQQKQARAAEKTGA